MPKRPERPRGAVILHFDYDCFYASVFEAETPSLKSLPLAVQQKQIVVTCNYEARRRGLYKLQLIKDAKTICPDVVIVLGEDLTRFRNASKELYAFLRSFSWNQKVERLGFDEVFMDVSDMISHNIALLNPNHLTNSFFHLSKTDPTLGFPFDASHLAGHTYPGLLDNRFGIDAELIEAQQVRLGLHLGSRLAEYLRHRLDAEKGYTCTVGISTNKLLAKLVGNLHKPNGQTTLLPSYRAEEHDNDGEADNVTAFLDGHEIGKIPGIGFKMAQKLRQHILQRPAAFDDGLVYGGTKEKVLVADVRKHPTITAESLDQILGGPGVPHGIGAKIWGLINGIDDTPVGQAREAPKQISIEDSYIRLDTLDEVLQELRMLAKSLIKRMHTDLLEDDDDDDSEQGEKEDSGGGTGVGKGAVTTHLAKRWLAYPKTLRLSTRPRPPQNPNGSRNRSFARISRSVAMPNFAFSLKESSDAIAERLVTETLVPLFRKLHPEKSGWNLSLVNVAATNMADAASDSKNGAGRDISKMFRRQDEVLRPFRVEELNPTPKEEEAAIPIEDRMGKEYGTAPQLYDPSLHMSLSDKDGRQTAALGSHSPEEGLMEDIQPSQPPKPGLHSHGSEDLPTTSQDSRIEGTDEWVYDSEDEASNSFQCDHCGAVMPVFAMTAHDRWHAEN